LGGDSGLGVDVEFHFTDINFHVLDELFFWGIKITSSMKSINRSLSYLSRCSADIKKLMS
jgi:hypothetical protein